MSAMRISSALLFFVLAIIPIAAFAATPASNRSSCFLSIATDPSTKEPKVFDTKTVATEISKYLDTVELCPTACFISETITVNAQQDTTSIQVQAVNKCGSDTSKQKADQLNLGCNAGQTKPQVVVKRTGMVTKNDASKERCGGTRVSAVVGSSIGDAAKDKVLQGLAQQAASNPELLNTPASRDQSAVVLKAFGVSDADARDLVDNKPDNAKALLQAFASGDQTKVQTAADNANVTLNPDLSDISSMSAKDVSDKFSGIYTPEQKQTAQMLSADVTGFGGNPAADPAAVQQALVNGFSAMCQNLGGCGDACANNPGTLTCRTNNPGALTWSAWEAKYGGQPCGQNNNTTCFPTLDQGLAAKIGLLIGPKYFGGDNNTILSALCNGYATNAAGNDCVAYANYVSRQSGIAATQTIDPQNPQQMGSIVMAMSRYENGRSVPYTPDQLQNALSLVYGGQLPAGTPGFVPTFQGGTNNPGVGLSLPFAVLSGNNGVYTNTYGSPFGSVYTPVSTGGPVSTGSPVSTGNPVSTGGVISTTNTTPVATVSAPAANPVASIIVQPVSPLANNPITVSWSSFGMQPNNPCRVLIQDASSTQTIKQSNEGSQVITASHPGTFTFTMQCLAIGGASIQQATSVSVR